MKSVLAYLLGWDRMRTIRQHSEKNSPPINLGSPPISHRFRLDCPSAFTTILGPSFRSWKEVR